MSNLSKTIRDIAKQNGITFKEEAENLSAYYQGKKIACHPKSALTCSFLPNSCIERSLLDNGRFQAPRELIPVMTHIIDKYDNATSHS